MTSYERQILCEVRAGLETALQLLQETVTPWIGTKEGLEVLQARIWYLAKIRSELTSLLLK